MAPVPVAGRLDQTGSTSQAPPWGIPACALRSGRWRGFRARLPRRYDPNRRSRPCPRFREQNAFHEIPDSRPFDRLCWLGSARAFCAIAL